MPTKRDLLRSAALAVITVTTTKYVPAQAQTTADRPGFLKAKDIAEAGFIYGLPIVMAYGIMYEYAVDRNSGQFKAPFNQLKNEPNVYTYKDTAVVTPNSDTPASGRSMRPLPMPARGSTAGGSARCLATAPTSMATG